MDYSSLLNLVDDLPIFSSSLLQAGDITPALLQKQLSRWVKTGKLIQLRRGLYVLDKPYRKENPHPFIIANQILTPSYISLQSALAYFNLIPENVPSVTSVTSRKRTKSFQTDLGKFDFHSIQPNLFSGFNLHEVSPSQNVFLARPEKALLDLIYFSPGGEKMPFLTALRLQNLDTLDFSWMKTFIAKLDKPKFHLALDNLIQLTETERYQSY